MLSANGKHLKQIGKRENEKTTCQLQLDSILNREKRKEMTEYRRLLFSSMFCLMHTWVRKRPESLQKRRTICWFFKRGSTRSEWIFFAVDLGDGDQSENMENNGARSILHNRRGHVTVRCLFPSLGKQNALQLPGRNLVQSIDSFSLEIYSVWQHEKYETWIKEIDQND